MKKLDYFWAQKLTKITGIIFFTQFILEQLVTRKEGFEYTVHFWGSLFVLAIIYSLALVVINARRARTS